MLPIGPDLLDVPRGAAAGLAHARHVIKRARRETMLRVIQPFTGIPQVRRAASRKAIQFYANSTVARPYPLSMLADYTSWRSLNDRSYTGRHLPPAEPTTPLPTAEKSSPSSRVAKTPRFCPKTRQPRSRSSLSGSPTVSCAPIRPTGRRTPRITASTCARSTASPPSARPCCGNRQVGVGSADCAARSSTDRSTPSSSSRMSTTTAPRRCDPSSSACTTRLRWTVSSPRRRWSRGDSPSRSASSTGTRRSATRCSTWFSSGNTTASPTSLPASIRIGTTRAYSRRPATS